MANDNLTELAKMFKDRENKSVVSITTGRVLQPLPKVKIQLNDYIILDAQKLLISEHIYLHYADSNQTQYLNIGDEVILIPTQDEQSYYVLDKARRLK